MRYITTETIIFLGLILGIIACVYMRKLDIAYFLGGFTLGRYI